MSKYKFYRYCIDIVMEGLRERGNRIGKTEYQRAYFLGSRNLQRVVLGLAMPDIPATEKEIHGASTRIFLASAEVGAISEKRISSIIVRDMITQKAVENSKVSVSSLDSLLGFGEFVTIAVPEESDLLPMALYRMSKWEEDKFVEFQKQFYGVTIKTGREDAVDNFVLFATTDKTSTSLTTYDVSRVNVVADSLVNRSLTFAVKVLMYRAAAPEKFVDGVVSVGDVVLKGATPKKALSFSLGDEKFSEEHYRSAHLRQLMNERYYQGVHAHKEVGSRVVFVSSTVVNRKTEDISTLESDVG